MGADLVTSSVVVLPENRGPIDLFNIAEDIRARTYTMQAALKYDETPFTDEEIHDYMLAAEGRDAELDPENITQEKLRQSFLKTITDFRNCIGYRDVCIMAVHDVALVLSGGMSWGDDPTESYSTILKFAYLPKRLLEEGGFE